ncbi:IS5 family transposase [Synechococcus sp. CCFWC 502]|nr:IS5 family transposase [Synechococcus sp. CCFWC 502]WFN57741.1 IS5 family transposase [Synechococcus sp. CCFWC 502]
MSRSRKIPYLQFFLGLEGFQFEAPFDPSMMVYFRRRLPEKTINDCNERIVRHGKQQIAQNKQGDNDDPDDGDGSVPAALERPSQDAKAPKRHQGILLIDATCVPSDIRYPTDLSLLNEARETTEKLIDEMHKQVRDVFGHKPRTNRRQFWRWPKKKRPRLSKIRKAIGQQLRHLARNLSSIECSDRLRCKSFGGWSPLVSQAVVRQQKILYHSDTRSIQDRIVSLTQPHIRPIVRGKTRNNVEFGAKISISVSGDGFAFLDRLSWDPYNEGEDLKSQVRTFHRRHGFYPKVVCADQIYRTRSNRALCMRHGIRLSGPRLGRPKNDPDLVAAEKKIALDDQRQRNGVEGKFGQGKRRFGLGLVREKLAETSGCTIAMNLLVMNLEKLLELLFVLIAIFQGLLMVCIASKRRPTLLISSGLSLATC